MRICSVMILLSMILLGSCRYDQVEPQDCIPLPFQGAGVSYFTIVGTKLSFPECNPSNSDEVIFLREHPSGSEIVKFNDQSKEEVVVAKDISVRTAIDWGENDTLLFVNSLEYHVYMLSVEGGVPVKITGTPANLYPIWDNNYRDIYYFHSPSLAIPYYYVKKNVMDLSLDTILFDGDMYNGLLRLGTLNANGEVAGRVLGGNDNKLLAYASIDSLPMEFIELVNMSTELNRNSLLGVTWSANGKGVYFTVFNEGLFYVNKDDRLLVKLLDFCNSMRYETISATADGNYLFGQRVDSSRDPDQIGQINEKHSIYKIDLNTLEETLVFE